VAGLKIGVFADNLGLPVRRGIEKAAELGAQCFQVFTTKGDLHPNRLDRAGRRNFKQFYEGLGLELSATCCDFFTGFTDAEKNPERISLTKPQIDLAADLEVGVITTHIGVVPEDERDPAWPALLSALEEVGAHAEARGVVFATETGPERGPVLARLIERLDTASVRVNFDPANFLIYGFDLWEAVESLKHYVVHSHAKDARRGAAGGRGKEVPLGQGDVDWPRYIKALRDVGYEGAYTIERESGPDPIGDVRHAVEFLKAF
jgi:L-ribulose-5-phosphate 3-epimerase